MTDSVRLVSISNYLPDAIIIFWFDDKGEYEDEVSELQLGDVKLHILDGTNWLYSKYLLNEEDKENK